MRVPERKVSSQRLRVLLDQKGVACPMPRNSLLNPDSPVVPRKQHNLVGACLGEHTSPQPVVSTCKGKKRPAKVQDGTGQPLLASGVALGFDGLLHHLT